MNHPKKASVIEHNWNAFSSDPKFQAARQKVDAAALQAEAQRTKEYAAQYFSFHFERERLRTWKARHGRLASSTERRLVEHGRLAAAAYKDAVASVAQLRDTLSSSGMSEVLERHMGALCEHLDQNPRTASWIEQFREMGISDTDIHCGLKHLAACRFNLFRFDGGDGTLSGFVERMGHQAALVEKSVHTMEVHGLPTIQGASGQTAGYVFIGLWIAGAFSLFLICCGMLIPVG